MLFLEEIRYNRTKDSAHYSIFHFYNSYFNILSNGNGCDFQTDVAGTHDRHPDAIAQPGTDALDVGGGAKRVDARQVSAGHRQLPWPRAGAQHQVAVPQHLTIGQGDGLRGAIDRGEFPPASKLPSEFEIGRQFGVTRERIRQIEAKTLAKLRHPHRSDRLRDYLEGA